MDIIEEIRKYKELLDEGILTQEEFDRKKTELLQREERESEREAASSESKAANAEYKEFSGGNAIKQYDKHIFAWVFCCLLGCYGADRFIRGQIVLGIIKLLTCGGIGIWALIDFIIALTNVYGRKYANVNMVAFDSDGNYVFD